MRVASGVGSGQLWKSTIAQSAPARRRLSMSSITLRATRCRVTRAARSSSRRRPRGSRRATIPGRRRSAARTHRCSRRGRAGGTTAGPARCRARRARLRREASSSSISSAVSSVNRRCVCPCSPTTMPVRCEPHDLVVGGTALDPASLHEQGARCAGVDQRVDHGPEVAVVAGMVTRLDVDRESEPHRPRAYFRGRMPAWKTANTVAR